MKKHSYIRAALSVAIVGVSALAANIALAAADPVAVWSGDFDDPNIVIQNGWTLNTEGCYVAHDGSYVMVDSKPLSIYHIPAVTETYVSAIVEINGISETGVLVDFGRQEGPEDAGWAEKLNGYKNSDMMGVMLDGSLPFGVWDGGKRANEPVLQQQFPDLLETHRVVVRFKPGANSGVYMYVDGTKIFTADSDLKASMDVKRINIGGFWHNGSMLMDGMQISKVAIFAGNETDDELLSYKFPEPPKRTDQVININVFQDGTAITQAQTTLASDSVQIPEDGWITVGQPSSGTATASSTTAYSLLDESTVTLGDPISITVYSQAGLNWAYWDRGDTPAMADPACAYMTCWASNRDRSCIPGSFKVENIPYDNYEVILYFQGGTKQTTGDYGTPTVEGQTPTGFDPIRVTSGNSKYNSQHYYKPDETGVLSVDTGLSASEEVKASDVITLSSMWGKRCQATAAYGVNAVRIENCTGTFEIHYWARTSGIAAMQIIDRSSSKTEATLREDKTWSQLWAGREEPGEGTSAQINVEGNPTLTLDKLPECDVIYFKGEGDVVIVSSSKERLADAISLFKGVQLSGSIVLEFNVKSGYAATEELRNAIKSAGNKLRFVFKGAGENGVTIDYDTTVLNIAFATHIVFDGGKHAIKARWHDANNSGGKFGLNATADNPTIRVAGGAYLTFNVKDLCGWVSGGSNANGIIRVDEGATAEIIPTNGTCYWAQQIYLEPGATLAINDNGTNFRVNGGTGSGATAQFYVPDNVSDMTDKPAIIKQLGTGGLYVNGEGTPNMSFYVGANSRLILDTALGSDHSGNQVTKYGAGILEASDGKLTDIPTWQLMGGTLVYDGELATVNLNSATLVGNEMVAISDTLHVAGGDSTAKNVMFFGTTFNFGNSNTKLIADNFVYSPAGDVASEGNGVVVAKDLTINKDTGLPSAVGLDVTSDDGILRLVATEWETGRKLCGGTLSAPNGKVKRTIYLGDKAYKTKVLFDTGAKTIKVFKPGLLFFVQ